MGCIKCDLDGLTPIHKLLSDLSMIIKKRKKNRIVNY